MRHGTANWVDVVIRNNQVDIGPAWPERIVPLQPQLRATLPPAVGRGDDLGVQRGVIFHLEPNAPYGRFQNRPFPILNIQGRCGVLDALP